MKLHIGAGSIYLDGWVNVDIPDQKTFLASERPDLVERWLTTEDKYYARHQDKTLDTFRIGPLDQEYVCDRFGSFDFLPIKDYEVEEVLIRQSFEHLSLTEARRALTNLYRAMRPGAHIRIDVPDHEETLQVFLKTGDRVWIRHLLGPRRSDHGYHLVGYRREMLTSLLGRCGFGFVSEEPNIHLYPAFCLRFRRL